MTRAATTTRPDSGIDAEVHHGLAGVVEDTTAISRVNPDTNSLIYRGYPAPELAASRSFLDVAYLIWHGELPTADQSAAFAETERGSREIPGTLSDLLLALPVTCHPMDALRTAVSWLGAADPAEADGSPESNLRKSLRLLAALPTVVALDHRRRHDLSPIGPDSSLTYAQNFFRRCFGTVPDEKLARSFEVSMILYAEHGFNASTFTARVITSTLSDLHSAVTGAIGALRGPLHGGANEAALATLQEIGPAANVDAWLDRALTEGRKIMGFGHRVYRHGDSRVPTMQAELEALAERTTDPQAAELLGTYRALADAMLKRKNIFPNVDYPSGLAYHLMGFDATAFTPMFVMARVVGWTAHIAEQLEHNKIIRPLSKYVGPAQREVPRPA